MKKITALVIGLAVVSAILFTLFVRTSGVVTWLVYLIYLIDLFVSFALINFFVKKQGKSEDTANKFAAGYIALLVVLGIVLFIISLIIF